MRWSSLLYPVLGILAAFAIPGCFIPPIPDNATLFTFEVIASYPHDDQAFTQGLVFEDGVMYEGTGIRGDSSLRRTDFETGEVLQQLDLASNFFGEGVTVFGDRIIQLTWQSNVGFVYELDTFDEVDDFAYPTEGWGLTHDGTQLIMSDGTDTLHFLDPDTFEELDAIQVFDDNGPVRRLNELEYIDGEVFANIWQTDFIVIINPDTGEIRAYIDLTGLLDPADVTGPVDVLNGIAYDRDSNRLFVTGKLWPKLYEIRLIPVTG